MDCFGVRGGGNEKGHRGFRSGGGEELAGFGICEPKFKRPRKSYFESRLTRPRSH